MSGVITALQTSTVDTVIRLMGCADPLRTFDQVMLVGNAAADELWAREK